jgi:hypothetical protein
MVFVPLSVSRNLSMIYYNYGIVIPTYVISQEFLDTERGAKHEKQIQIRN